MKIMWWFGLLAERNNKVKERGHHFVVGECIEEGFLSNVESSSGMSGMYKAAGVISIIDVESIINTYMNLRKGSAFCRESGPIMAFWLFWVIIVDTKPSSIQLDYDN